MLYVLLSVFCSVLVSVLLKLARRYQVDMMQAIMWNYAMAAGLTWVFLKPQLNADLHNAPVYNYLALGILLPAVFVMLAASVRLAGIVRTDVAQRLSLFIPILAAVFVFGESISPLKTVGILVGFAAIVCSIPWQKGRGSGKTSGSWFYLLAVFLGFGVIDVLFKQMAQFKEMPYTTSLFIVYVMSFIAAVIGFVIKLLRKMTKFSFPHILIGWVLGIFNFGNILFYLKAHRALSSQPSTVFSAMNMGVIVLGALVGLFIFKEKLSTLNKAGLVLALIAIVIITYSTY